VRAKELKAAGMDWTEVLAAEGESPRARLAAELLGSATYGSTAARVQAFVEQGGGCRATFFNYRSRLAGENGFYVLLIKYVIVVATIASIEPACSERSSPSNGRLSCAVHR
jgi:hypothetical protein